MREFPACHALFIVMVRTRFVDLPAEVLALIGSKLEDFFDK